MLDIDLNCAPPVDLAELPPAAVSEGIDLHSVPPVDLAELSPAGGHSLNEAYRGAFVTSKPCKTSNQLNKRRGRQSFIDLPTGWLVDERVRLSGQSAGHKDEYYIEPGTGKKFRSLVEVAHHLELLSSKPSQKQDQEV